jgi:hypothetical protein
MAANLLGRYIWEISELSRSRHGLTLSELNDRWEDCSLYDGKKIIRKTWYSHREQIASQFGIIIECDKRTNRYHIAYRDEIGKPDIQNWLLNSFAVGNMLLQGQDLKGRILCEQIPSGYEYLTEIIQAMRENKIIRVTYQSFWKREPATFELMPYAVRVFKQRWYLIGGNVAFKNKDIRIYALDRMQDLEITNHKFKLPRGFHADELFDDVYGSTLATGDKVEHVVINVYNGQEKYFRSLKIHHSQNELSSENGCTVFEYYLKPTYEFIQELLSHGPDVEVIQPERLRKTMKQWIKQMNDLYK